MKTSKGTFVLHPLVIKLLKWNISRYILQGAEIVEALGAPEEEFVSQRKIKNFLFI